MADIIFGKFVWHSEKEAKNIAEHKMNFTDATKAFLDEKRIIAVDSKHSKDEARYFCIGKVGTKIATVRFTYRGDIIRIIGAGFWRNGVKKYEEEN